MDRPPTPQAVDISFVYWGDLGAPVPLEVEESGSAYENIEHLDDLTRDELGHALEERLRAAYPPAEWPAVVTAVWRLVDDPALRSQLAAEREPPARRAPPEMGQPQVEELRRAHSSAVSQLASLGRCAAEVRQLRAKLAAERAREPEVEARLAHLRAARLVVGRGGGGARRGSPGPLLVIGGEQVGEQVLHRRTERPGEPERCHDLRSGPVLDAADRPLGDSARFGEVLLELLGGLAGRSEASRGVHGSAIIHKRFWNASSFIRGSRRMTYSAPYILVAMSSGYRPERVKTLRTRLGMTQKQLAEAAGGGGGGNRAAR